MRNYFSKLYTKCTSLLKKLSIRIMAHQIHQDSLVDPYAIHISKNRNSDIMPIKYRNMRAQNTTAYPSK
jgi:hypothetical protein